LYRELATAFKNQPSVETLAHIIDDQVQSRRVFEDVRTTDFYGERALVAYLESAQAVLFDVGGDALANHYFNLLETFIEKFSLRYDLRRPCTLCPTLPGVFASLVHDLRVMASKDVHLDALMKEFENSIRDLRSDCSDGHIKTCIHKQINLLEAIGIRLVPFATKLAPGLMKK
jgi:hypothetical protein